MRVLILEDLMAIDLDQICAIRKKYDEYSIEIVMQNGTAFELGLDDCDAIDNAWEIITEHWSEQPEIFFNPKRN